MILYSNYCSRHPAVQGMWTGKGTVQRAVQSLVSDLHVIVVHLVRGSN